MFDHLATYYYEHVVSTFVEYREKRLDRVSGHSKDLRLAMASTIAMVHLLDHLRGHLPGRTGLSRKDIELACPDYGLLADIANAAKHKLVTKSTPHGAPLVDDAAKLTERISIISFKDDQGAYSDYQKSVLVELSDGSERDILDVLTNVMNFWEEFMVSLGVIPTARKFAYDATIRPRSREECEKSRLQLEHVQGQYFHGRFQVLHYDYATGTAKPPSVPLAKVEMKFYRIGDTHEESAN